MLSSTYVQCSMLMVVIDCLLTCIRTYLRRSEQRIDKGSINRSIDRATMPRRTSVKEQSFLNFNTTPDCAFYTQPRPSLLVSLVPSLFLSLSLSFRFSFCFFEYLVSPHHHRYHRSITNNQKIPITFSYSPPNPYFHYFHTRGALYCFILFSFTHFTTPPVSDITGSRSPTHSRSISPFCFLSHLRA